MVIISDPQNQVIPADLGIKNFYERNRSTLRDQKGFEMFFLQFFGIVVRLSLIRQENISGKNPKFAIGGSNF